MSDLPKEQLIKRRAWHEERNHEKAPANPHILRTLASLNGIRALLHLGRRVRR